MNDHAPIPPPPNAPATVPEAPRDRPAWTHLGMFRGLTGESLRELRAAMTEVNFGAGASIIEQAAEGDDMYVLAEGSVRVKVRGNNRETVFDRLLNAPALVGEMALVTHGTRSASVSAESECRCLRLDRRTFEQVMARNSQVATFLTKIVGERLLEAGTIRKVGKYEVVGRLGAGAVATVFEAVHPELGQHVALKMLSHAMVYHPGFAAQFRSEARLVASLNHEHIVRVLDTAQAYGTHFIVMEKLTGTMLEDIVAQGQRLPWGMIRRILREVCSALAYSHEHNLLHRDIKPSNVFLTEDRRVKLLDFGIATSTESSETGGGHLLGTPYYMAPEQIRGERLDGRADLYALGIMAYELSTLNVPFDADTLDDLLRKHLHEPLPDPKRISPDIPDDLVQFMEVATAKDPADRFSDCGAALEFLQAATELPLVRKLELSTLAISYHPTRRHLVAEALTQLHRELSDVPGISLLFGHQASEIVSE